MKKPTDKEFRAARKIVERCGFMMWAEAFAKELLCSSIELKVIKKS